MKEWAKENGLEALYNEYMEAVETIREECEAEGYPGNGSNAELRIEQLQEGYPELFGDDYGS